MKTLQVLLAEDNAGDVFLVREALRAHKLTFELTVVRDALEAFSHIEHLGVSASQRCPDVFLLDLNLPKGNGYDILKSFRGHPRCAQVPVIIVTSSDAPADRTQADLLGANEYFRKPSDLTEFLMLGGIIKRMLDWCPAEAI